MDLEKYKFKELRNGYCIIHRDESEGVQNYSSMFKHSLTCESLPGL